MIHVWRYLQEELYLKATPVNFNSDEAALDRSRLSRDRVKILNSKEKLAEISAKKERKKDSKSH